MAMNNIRILAAATFRILAIAEAEPSLARVFNALEWTDEIPDAQVVDCDPDCPCDGANAYLAINPNWLAQTTPLEAIWKVRAVIDDFVAKEKAKQAEPVIEVIEYYEGGVQDVDDTEWN